MFNVLLMSIIKKYKCRRVVWVPCKRSISNFGNEWYQLSKSRRGCTARTCKWKLSKTSKMLCTTWNAHVGQHFHSTAVLKKLPCSELLNTSFIYCPLQGYRTELTLPRFSIQEVNITQHISSKSHCTLEYKTRNNSLPASCTVEAKK